MIELCVGCIPPVARPFSQLVTIRDWTFRGGDQREVDCVFKYDYHN